MLQHPFQEIFLDADGFRMKERHADVPLDNRVAGLFQIRAALCARFPVPQAKQAAFPDVFHATMGRTKGVRAVRSDFQDFTAELSIRKRSRRRGDCCKTSVHAV